jgi:nucleotide-binding universal stress UspA family protein
MHTLQSPAAAPQEGVRAQHTSPVIVATDGRDQSDAAMVVGRLLAGTSDALRVITVLKALPMVSPEAAVPISADVQSARRAELRRAVVEQTNRIWGEPAVDVELTEGEPASTIARIARDSNATMIVSGIGRHQVMDRLFGDETAIRLVRLSSVPVFTVAGRLMGAPHRIVVAADFSETSLRAARLALELAAPHATLYLAHVGPRDKVLHDWNAWGLSYKEDAGDALQKMAQHLRVPPGMTLQRVLLQGDPATELLAFATSVNADLIATGSHGYGFVARMLIGSVTTRILRCSTCSVLCVPHAAAMTRLRVSAAPSEVTTIPRPDWAPEMDSFTRRNVGRRGTLEVDDPEIGAQAQENDYPLLGATFDSHDQRLELMFGEPGDRGHHLTRSIGNIREIDTLTNESGHDIALRIVHGTGQTLLTFAN